MRPQDHAAFTGEEFLVLGLPLSWTKEAVAAFLAPWDPNVQVRYSTVQRFERRWVVRSTMAAPSEALVNADGLRVTATVEPLKKQSVAKPVLKFVGKGKGKGLSLIHI